MQGQKDVKLSAKLSKSKKACGLVIDRKSLNIPFMSCEGRTTSWQLSVISQFSQQILHKSITWSWTYTWSISSLTRWLLGCSSYRQPAEAGPQKTFIKISFNLFCLFMLFAIFYNFFQSKSLNTPEVKCNLLMFYLLIDYLLFFSKVAGGLGPIVAIKGWVQTRQLFIRINIKT